MKTSFLKICTGISILLVSASLFVFSLSQAVANDSPKSFPVAPELMNSPQESGKIMFNMYRNPIYNSSGEFKYWEVDAIAWNTETGKSKLYWFGLKDNEYNWNESERFSFPENPLGDE